MLRKITMIFENSENRMGYVLNPDTKQVKIGKMDENFQITHVIQDGNYSNAEDICKQIYNVLIVGMTNGSS